MAERAYTLKAAIPILRPDFDPERIASAQAAAKHRSTHVGAIPGDLQREIAKYSDPRIALQPSIFNAATAFDAKLTGMSGDERRALLRKHCVGPMPTLADCEYPTRNMHVKLTPNGPFTRCVDGGISVLDEDRKYFAIDYNDNYYNFGESPAPSTYFGPNGDEDSVEPVHKLPCGLYICEKLRRFKVLYYFLLNAETGQRVKLDWQIGDNRSNFAIDDYGNEIANPYRLQTYWLCQNTLPCAIIPYWE